MKHASFTGERTRTLHVLLSHIQELAWGSFALLKNTNSCGVLLLWKGAVVMVRGSVGESSVSSTDPQAALASLSRVSVVSYLCKSPVVQGIRVKTRVEISP